MVASIVLSSKAAYAQADQPARFEAGGQVAALLLKGNPRPGAGFWFDFNVARPLALEARSTWLTDSSPISAVHTAIGVRATFVRTSRVSVLGVALPGWYREAFEGEPGSFNSFALDLGAGMSFAATRRLMARVELDRIIIAIAGSTVDAGPDVGPVKLPGLIGSNWDLRAGVSYSFGSALRDSASSEAAVAGRWTAGPELGYTYASSAVVMGAIGAFVSYHLAPHCDADGSVSTLLSGDLPIGEGEGGRMTQALAGIKVGVREGRFGVFFKIRAGMNSFGDGAADYSGVHRKTVPALDLGGVVEVAMSRTSFVRADVGETLSFVGNGNEVRVLTRTGVAIVDGSPTELYTLPMRVGIGWRF